MDNFATKNNFLTRGFGVAYRKSAEVDKSYVENLSVPNSSKTIGYGDLFERTRQNLIQAWSGLARALNHDDATMFTLPNANLDTGKDNAGKYVYWS